MRVQLYLDPCDLLILKLLISTPDKAGFEKVKAGLPMEANRTKWYVVAGLVLILSTFSTNIRADLGAGFAVHIADGADAKAREAGLRKLAPEGESLPDDIRERFTGVTKLGRLGGSTLNALHGIDGKNSNVDWDGHEVDWQAWRLSTGSLLEKSQACFAKDRDRSAGALVNFIAFADNHIWRAFYDKESEGKINEKTVAAFMDLSADIFKKAKEVFKDEADQKVLTKVENTYVKETAQVVKDLFIKTKDWRKTFDRKDYKEDEATKALFKRAETVMTALEKHKETGGKLCAFAEGETKGDTKDGGSTGGPTGLVAKESGAPKREAVAGPLGAGKDKEGTVVPPVVPGPKEVGGGAKDLQETIDRLTKTNEDAKAKAVADLADQERKLKDFADQKALDDAKLAALLAQNDPNRGLEAILKELNNNKKDETPQNQFPPITPPNISSEQPKNTPNQTADTPPNEQPEKSGIDPNLLAALNQGNNTPQPLIASGSDANPWKDAYYSLRDSRAAAATAPVESPLTAWFKWQAELAARRNEAMAKQQMVARTTNSQRLGGGFGGALSRRGARRGRSRSRMGGFGSVSSVAGRTSTVPSFLQ